MSTAAIDRVVSEIESAADEAVAFTRDLIRIPTVNPPGEAYEDCARLIGDRLARVRVRRRVLRRRRPARTHLASSPHQRRRHQAGARGASHRASERPLRRRPGRRRLDASIRSAAPSRTGASTGAASCDMKAGIAAALFAAGSHPPRWRDAGRLGRDQRHRRRGKRRIRRRRVARRTRADQREPHRLRDHPGAALRRSDLRRPPRRLLVRGPDARPHRARQHAVSRRPARSITWASSSIGCGASCCRASPRRTTAVPVDPAGGAARDAEHQRHRGRPAGATASRRRASRTPAARCSIAASCSRKGSTRPQAEIVDAARRDRRGRAGAALRAAGSDGRPPGAHAGRIRRSSPRSSGRCVECWDGAASWSPARAPTTRSTSRGSPACPHCVAYGPGILDLAHQPDEYCGVDDLITATKVIALAVMDLAG